jgi:hypothetical protein
VNLVRDDEALVLRPTVDPLRDADLLHTQRLAVCGVMPCLVGAPYAMMLFTITMVGRSCSALKAFSAELIASMSFASSTCWTAQP